MKNTSKENTLNFKQKIRIEDSDGIGRIFVDGVELHNVVGYELKRYASKTTHLLIQIVENSENLELNFSTNDVRNNLGGNV